MIVDYSFGERYFSLIYERPDGYFIAGLALFLENRVARLRSCRDY